jgi:hypothetical protein
VVDKKHLVLREASSKVEAADTNADGTKGTAVMPVVLEELIKVEAASTDATDTESSADTPVVVTSLDRDGTVVVRVACSGNVCANIASLTVILNSGEFPDRSSTRSVT